MEILDFFKPLDVEKLYAEGGFDPTNWIHAIEFYDGTTPDLTDKKLAIIGIISSDEEKGAAWEVRKYLYKLKKSEYAHQIIDLGDFHCNYKEKSFESLGFALSELMSNNLVPVILNGSQELTYAQYLSFN
jgi:hypothetical protein